MDWTRLIKPFKVGQFQRKSIYSGNPSEFLCKCNSPKEAQLLCEKLNQDVCPVCQKPIWDGQHTILTHEDCLRADLRAGRRTD